MMETERLRSVHAKRAEEAARRYGYWNPAPFFLVQRLERDVADRLRRNGLLPLGERRVLEAGCGSGYWLRFALRLGAQPHNLHGVDILPERVRDAYRLSPNFPLLIGDAARLPYEDGYFDLVMQFTMFTSILDDGLRRRAAAEMLRVLKPSGTVLWYDFILNPGNPDTRGIRAREVRSLFPGCQVRIRRATLAPPISRRLAPFSWLACYLLELIPWLRTHYLATVTKTGGHP